VSHPQPREAQVAEVVLYVVQPFEFGVKRRIAPATAIEARSADHARRMAERFAAAKAGAIAFSRRGDPTTGDWEDAKILAVLGEVSEEALDPA
jgi:hypothetical protein